MINSKHFVNCVSKDCKKNVIIHNELRLLVHILVADWGEGGVIWTLGTFTKMLKVVVQAKTLYTDFNLHH